MKKSAPNTDELLKGLLEGNRACLAQAITLIESRATKHQLAAQQLMKAALPHTGKSMRIGLTGTPGSGKSTFTEAFGTMLCDQGKKVAVLAIDPSSSRTGGSILGDKTRMEELSRHKNAFVRPSPSGKSLGGVALRTREALLLTEAAGYNVIIVETVGVGQSETAVRTMTDFFLLLQIAGAGDELQGIKKGVIELADAIVVNKADGGNLIKAKQAQAEYSRVLRYLQPFTKAWKPKALTCSALTSTGIREIWNLIENFRETTGACKVFETRRKEQNIDWFHSLMEQAIIHRFKEENKRHIQIIDTEVYEGLLPVSTALNKILKVD